MEDNKIDNILAPFIEWAKRRNKDAGKRNVIAMSKETFKKVYDLLKDEEDIVFISIEYTDSCARCGEVEDNEHYAESSDRVLNLEFDDCSEPEQCDGYWITPITPTDLSKLEWFITKNKDKHFIIHCRAGQSRSQGVLRAMMVNCPDWFEEDPINELNPCHTPNYAVSSGLGREIRIMRAALSS